MSLNHLLQLLRIQLTQDTRANIVDQAVGDCGLLRGDRGL